MGPLLLKAKLLSQEPNSIIPKSFQSLRYMKPRRPNFASLNKWPNYADPAYKQAYRLRDFMVRIGVYDYTVIATMFRGNKKNKNKN